MDEHAGNARVYRALAPRQTQSGEVTAPTTPPVDEGKTTKRASTACKECKRRRTRCSTGNPCSECAAHNRQCVYDETADKRRKAYIKHTQNQLHFFRGFLERLLASIRHADTQRLAELIGVIRGGGTNYDILSVVQTILGDASRTNHVDGDRRDGDQVDGDQEDGDQEDGDQEDGDQEDGEQIDGDSDDAEGSESLSGFAEGRAESKTWALIEFI